MNIHPLLKQIENDLKIGGDIAIDAQVFKLALESTLSDQMTLSELMSNIGTYVKKNIETESMNKDNSTAPLWWPSGHSHGCCGNYDGSCYYWHPICYIHDKMSENVVPDGFVCQAVFLINLTK